MRRLHGLAAASTPAYRTVWKRGDALLLSALPIYMAAGWLLPPAGVAASTPAAD